ncbi:MAG: hypothetical protein UT91_C0017G0007 [Parcubacteria group bacterium GW2011_GWA2_40_23]|nr:MAG: hypothetical protein UT91_C0017G0007 [Parcubacteria group bacterium GW2011_GWA2_40_23]
MKLFVTKKNSSIKYVLNAAYRIMCHDERMQTRYPV